jgi:hypothetical protein
MLARESQEELQRFETKVRAISRLAFLYGIENSENPDESNPSSNERFVAACHKGYSLAQEELISELTILEGRISLLKNELKRTRQSKADDKDNARQQTLELRILKWENRLLRRIADGIAWSLLGCRRWVARRLFAFENQPSLLNSNIETVIEAARKINQDPLCFALLCDITSFIQISDLFVHDISPNSRGDRFVEVKSGIMNERLLDLITSPSFQCPRAQYYAFCEVGESGMKQADRILRQQIKRSQVKELVTTGRGIDQLTGKDLRIKDGIVELHSWDAFLDNVYGQMGENNYATCGVGGDILWIGLFREPWPGSSIGFFSDYLFQSLSLTESPWGSHDRPVDGLYPIYNMELGLFNPLTPPLFVRELRSEFIWDLYFGRITVLIYIDFDRLAEEFRKHDLAFSWLSRKATARLSTKGRVSDYFMVNGKGIEISSRLIVGEGLINQILYEGVMPDSIISQGAHILSS